MPSVSVDTGNPEMVAPVAPVTSEKTPTLPTAEEGRVPGVNPWFSFDGFPALMYRLALAPKYGPVALLMYTIPETEHDYEDTDPIPALPFIMLVLREGHEEADLQALTDELANQKRRTVYEFSEEWLASASEVFGRPVRVVAIGKPPKQEGGSDGQE